MRGCKYAPGNRRTSVAAESHAADLMSRGSVLVEMHNRTGTDWYLVPGHKILPQVATALLCRPDVQPSNDGLFPGISQTFKLKR